MKLAGKKFERKVSDKKRLEKKVKEMWNQNLSLKFCNSSLFKKQFSPLFISMNLLSLPSSSSLLFPDSVDLSVCLGANIRLLITCTNIIKTQPHPRLLIADKYYSFLT